MQKKVKYSIGGLVAVSILGLGLVQHNDKVHVENKLKQKVANIKKQQKEFDTASQKMQKEKEAVEAEKGSLAQRLADQENKTKETEGKLEQALVAKKAKEDAIAQENAYNEQLKQNATLTTVSTSKAVESQSAPVNNSSAKEWIAKKESGGSYTATNGQYQGRYQLSASYLGGDNSQENQERVADSYVAGRYGSWEAAKAFHIANGWY